MEAEMRSLKPKNEQQLFIRESNEPRETIRIEGIMALFSQGKHSFVGNDRIEGTTTRVQVEVQVRFIGFETSDMNCAYQYPHPAHPQNVMAMVPTTSQQNHVPSTDTEYLEVMRKISAATYSTCLLLRVVVGEEQEEEEEEEEEEEARRAVMNGPRLDARPAAVAPQSSSIMEN
ncbi:hypothetical protein HZH68_007949 [Vespula germanica]|uniref:Uncharacterized protein n=1 Tax=Vespula germanica TaxID=30212 RepID=A0A834K4P0_VESGE|nr:hypothetical protein HZH68_007949 [Vespula germanica]